ncbi:MAG: ELWxxDGT repeat protein [Cyanobacteria bacterium P01_A01_bin.84]
MSKLYLAKDILPGNQSANPGELTAVNGNLFFVANDGISGFELWQSDGTSNGTFLVKDIANGIVSPSISDLTNINGQLFFRADDVNGLELWISDGTSDGTIVFKDINPGSDDSQPFGLTSVDGNFYFAANNGINGLELWKSDGTPNGTFLVKDIRPGSDSTNISNLTNINGTLFFSANDGVNGTELWKSDGTPNGTFLVKDIEPNNNFSSGSSFPNSFTEVLTEVNNTLFFTATDSTNGSELWKSDGSSEGTVLVKDINPGSDGSFPTELVEIDGNVFFTATGSNGGYELWKSDGSSEGTVLVKDINPGSNASFPEDLVNVNGTLFFGADDGVNGYELWKSDGSSDGTVLVKDINPGENSSRPSGLIEVNGKVYFRADDGINGTELWESDGSSEGTVLVGDINLGTQASVPTNFTRIDNTLFFTANDGKNGRELWVLDTEGNSPPQLSNPILDQFIDIGGNFQLDINHTFEDVEGDRLNISATLDNGEPLPSWLKFDPTTATFTGFPTDNDRGSFSVTVIADDGNGNLTRDGFKISIKNKNATIPQPYLVKDIIPGVESAITTGNLTKVNETLFFVANDGENGIELWKSDGTEVGTAIVKDIAREEPSFISSFPSNLVDINGTLFFTATNEFNPREAVRTLFKSDGTEDGTVDLTTFIGAAAFEEFTNVNGTLFFAGGSGSSNQGGDIELWKSDGTAEGTVLVKDIVPGDGLRASSSPKNLTNLNGRLYFNVLAFGDRSFAGLYSSDGTTEGTVAVTQGFLASSLTVFEDSLFFSAESIDGTKVNGEGELWKSDGTGEGTVLVKDINPGDPQGNVSNLLPINQTLYFTANDGVNGQELWKSDGTGEGTVLVKDINPGSKDSNIQQLTDVDGVLYFTANDGVNGQELWKSDGTSEGTVLVKDINPGSEFSNPDNLTNVNGNLYFTVNDLLNGKELWQSDGTAGGTIIVTDINPGNFSSDPTGLTNIDGTLYFTADNGVNGRELWAIDTVINSAPTVVNSIGHQTVDAYNQFKLSLDENIFDDPDGDKLTYSVSLENNQPLPEWLKFDPKTATLRGFPTKNDIGCLCITVTVSDTSGEEVSSSFILSIERGNTPQPYLVKDINLGEGFGINDGVKLVKVNDILYFATYDGIYGVELWKSDETTEVTVLVTDISLGSTSSEPDGLINIDGTTINFTADDGINGGELWALDV